MSEPGTQTALKNEIASARQQMTDGVKNAADTVKADAANEVSSVAEAAEAARDTLPEDHIADPMLDHAVQALGQVAEHLKSTDIDALAHQASDFARRNPALVLGGAALLGFAAARFLKAGPQRAVATAPQDPWTDHLEQS